ncbi:MAG TPA: ABC transporter ATP-binding protein [Candidatus Elarobacter sp.]|jgi:NitT/TauT family transport system ATP-binding protein|nr:ABC transporter ATP-binding protein [Candidatus Elarobacter sp.]
MSAPRLVFDGVGHSYQDRDRTIEVLRDFSLGVAEGEFVSIVGPSGCGKTTLLNIVAGFVIPRSGNVLLDGRPIGGPGSDRGMVFQEYGVFPWLSVRENIAFGLRLRANRRSRAEIAAACDHYLDVMRLREFADVYPRSLSGGMRQRLALARAYAVHPRFLLMDEPFGALDAQTRSSMQNALLGLQAEDAKTVLFVTHSVEEALFLSTRVVAVSARPSRIRRVIDVPFPYPRTDALRRAPEFQQLVADLSEIVMREYEAQQSQLNPNYQLVNEGT